MVDHLQRHTMQSDIRIKERSPTGPRNTTCRMSRKGRVCHVFAGRRNNSMSTLQWTGLVMHICRASRKRCCSAFDCRIVANVTLQTGTSAGSGETRRINDATGTHACISPFANSNRSYSFNTPRCILYPLCLSKRSHTFTPTRPSAKSSRSSNCQKTSGGGCRSETSMVNFTPAWNQWG